MPVALALVSDTTSFLPKLTPATDPYLAALADRVLVFDGATGTNLQMMELTAEDFGGPALEGCNEILVATRPDAIERLHTSFLEIGSDVIETDSFGSFSIVLAEYDLADRAFELSRTAAELARRCADRFSTPEKPRFVAGSMGPGTKFPTLGQIPYTELRESRLPACSPVVSTCSSSRRCSTSSAPRPPSTAAASPWPTPGDRCRSRSR